MLLSSIALALCVTVASPNVPRVSAQAEDATAQAEDPSCENDDIGNFWTQADGYVYRCELTEFGPRWMPYSTGGAPPCYEGTRDKYWWDDSIPGIRSLKKCKKTISGAWFWLPPDADDHCYRTPPVLPCIDPPSQEADENGRADYRVQAPEDPDRPTALEMCYGDSICETRMIPQGTASSAFDFSHTFAGIGTYAQRATILETGAFAESQTTHPPDIGEESSGSGNFVGVMKVFGNRADTSTVTVVGNQYAGEASESRSQTVSGNVAMADNERTGWFQV